MIDDFSIHVYGFALSTKCDNLPLQLVAGLLTVSKHSLGNYSYPTTAYQ